MLSSAARPYVSPICYRGLQGDRSNNVYLLVGLNPIINSIKCTREIVGKVDCFTENRIVAKIYDVDLNYIFLIYVFVNSSKDSNVL